MLPSGCGKDQAPARGGVLKGLSEIEIQLLCLSTAVDSAIATMLCVGVINLHSTGIGGGGFMLVYNRSGQVAEVFDFREIAPAAATKDMFKNASYKELNSE